MIYNLIFAGFVWITGRIKELIITSGGENIAPVPIEQQLKLELLLCAYCVVVGDMKKFLSLLVTVKSKLSPLGAPTDELDEEAVAICKGLGVELTKVSEAMESAEVKQYIQEGINRANEKAISNAARVQVSFCCNFVENTNSIYLWCLEIRYSPTGPIHSRR